MFSLRGLRMGLGILLGHKLARTSIPMTRWSLIFRHDVLSHRLIRGNLRLNLSSEASKAPARWVLPGHLSSTGGKGAERPWS